MSEPVSELEVGGARPITRPCVVILGASAVGKTAIVQRFLLNSYPDTHIQTVEELHNCTNNLCHFPLQYDILDTAGSYEFPEMRRLAIEKGDAFILVYAIDDSKSFEYVSSLRDTILDIRQKIKKPAPIVIIGNKSDMELFRQVDKSKADFVVTWKWGHTFMESSAKENKNIETIFKIAKYEGKISFPDRR